MAYKGAPALFSFSEVPHLHHGLPAGCVRCAISHPAHSAARQHALRALFAAFNVSTDAQLVDTLFQLSKLTDANNRWTEKALDFKLIMEDLVLSDPAQSLYQALIRVNSRDFREKMNIITVSKTLYRICGMILNMLNLTSPELTARFAKAFTSTEILKCICQLLEDHEVPSVRSAAVFLVHMLLLRDSDCSLQDSHSSEKKRLFRNLMTFASTDFRSIHRAQSDETQKWQISLYGCLETYHHQTYHVLQARLPRKWSCFQQMALSSIEYMLHRPDGVVSKIDALSILKDCNPSSIGLALLDVVEGKYSFRTEFHSTIAYWQGVHIILLLSTIPSMPYSPMYVKTAVEKDQWKASMQAIELLSRTPKFFSRLERVWVEKRKETIADLRKIVTDDIRICTDSKGVQHDIWKCQLMASHHTVLGILRIVLNAVYQATDSKKPLYHLLPWLKHAYEAVKVPSDTVRQNLVVSSWVEPGVEVPKVTEDDGSHSHLQLSPLLFIAPTLCLQLMNFLFQPEQYALLHDSSKAEALAQSPFAAFSKAEIINFKRLSTEPYVKAVIKAFCLRPILARSDLKERLYCENNRLLLGQYLDLIEMVTAFKQLSQSVDTLNLPWFVHRDHPALDMQQLEDLLMYATNFEFHNAEKWDKSAGPDRPNRMIKMVEEAVKSLKPLDPPTTPLFEQHKTFIQGLIEKLWAQSIFVEQDDLD